MSLIAGAIISVRTLLPTPDPVDAAAFQPAPTVIFPVALSEYQERVTVLHPASTEHGLGTSTAQPSMTLVGLSHSLEETPKNRSNVTEAGQPTVTATTSFVPQPSNTGPITSSSESTQSPTSGSSSTESTADASTEESSPGPNLTASTEETSASSSETTAASPERASGFARMAIPSTEISTTDPAGEFVLHYVPPAAANSAYARQVVEKLKAVAPDLVGQRAEEPPIEAPPTTTQGPSSSNDFPTALYRLILDSSVGPDGQLVPADVAAERVVELFDQVRMAPAPGDPPVSSDSTGPMSVSRQEPIGVEVDANVDLSGLRDQAVWLHWSVYTETGGTRLFGKWLGSVVAAQLIPSSDHDTGSVSFWIPMPADPGPYKAKLELFSNGSRLASATTDPFN